VQNLSPEYTRLRQKLLNFASVIGNLPRPELERLECPQARYLSGWSCGKEKLANGRFDTLKGSYYINTAFYRVGVFLKRNLQPVEAMKFLYLILNKRAAGSIATGCINTGRKRG
jgi:hypothetical protein